MKPQKVPAFAIMAVWLTQLNGLAQDICHASETSSLRSSADDYEFISNAVPYARLSDAAYGKSAPPATYKELDRTVGDEGFEVASYKGASEIVVAFAGTDIKQSADLATDAISALDPTATPSQFKQAADYVTKLKANNPGMKITLTGHSLGGQIAMYVGGISNLDAVAFNAPPPNLKMKEEISTAQVKNIDFSAKPLVLNFTSREGYASHTGLTEDLISDDSIGMRRSYGHVIQVPVQGSGTIGATGIKKTVRYTQSFLSYHYIKELGNAMESLSKEGGRQEYERITRIWNESDSKNRSSQRGIYDSQKIPVPGIDFENKTTIGGGAPPFELPGIDFKNGTTTGGGGPPIPIPQIPPLPDL